MHNIFCRIRTHTHLVKHRAVFVKSEVIIAKQGVRIRRKMTSTFFFRRVVANSQQMPHFWRVFTILHQKYKKERKILHKNRKYATQQQKVVTKQKKMSKKCILKLQQILNSRQNSACTDKPFASSWTSGILVPRSSDLVATCCATFLTFKISFNVFAKYLSLFLQNNVSIFSTALGFSCHLLCKLSDLQNITKAEILGIWPFISASTEMLNRF